MGTVKTLAVVWGYGVFQYAGAAWGHAHRSRRLWPVGGEPAGGSPAGPPWKGGAGRAAPTRPSRPPYAATEYYLNPADMIHMETEIPLGFSAGRGPGPRPLLRLPEGPAGEGRRGNAESMVEAPLGTPALPSLCSPLGYAE